MKFKSLYISSLAFLISCETSYIDTIYTPSDDVSFFISQDDNYTKGSPIDSVQMLSNIGVFATITTLPYDKAATYEPNFMVNQKVEQIDGKWVYSPVQKWSYESDSLISFFAYAPFANTDNGLSIIQESDKMPTIYYQVPQTNTLHPDLMVATPVYDRVKSQGAVGLSFKHALAAISFSVKGDTSREITDVRISNVVPAATLSVDSLHIAWSAPANRTTQYYDLGLLDDNLSLRDEDIATSITATDGYLMMIPQDITDVEIEVTVKNETDLIYLNFEPGSEWVAGAKYNYVINLDTETVSSYDISQTSNCYIVDNTTITDLYIPINQRINAFWHDYSGLSELEFEKYMIDNNSEWQPKIVWYDNEKLSDASVEHYEGTVPDDCNTSKSYVCDVTDAVMKVTLPANTAVGNILIAVTKEIDGVESILWSWHLWVTDYNPDSDITATSNSSKYKVDNGKIHRYVKEDSEIWSSGLYANSFAMDRDIGSHDDKSTDALFYQWGRKDPFTTNIGWSIVKDCATFATAVQNPNIFYAMEDSWCSELSDDAYEAVDYLWYDITKFNPLTHTNITEIEKSIFDPSPLGWCVPLSEAYADWGTRYNYDRLVYFCMSGDIFPTTGKLHEYGETTSLWCADKASCSDAYFPYITDQTFSVDIICMAYGHRIRPVKIAN